MSDIPEDVMKAAWEALGYRRLPNSPVSRYRVSCVARAIMAERARCFAIKPDPDITTEDPEKPYTSGYVEGFWDAVARYRAAIRPRP